MHLTRLKTLLFLLLPLSVPFHSGRLLIRKGLEKDLPFTAAFPPADNQLITFRRRLPELLPAGIGKDQPPEFEMIVSAGRTRPPVKEVDRRRRLFPAIAGLRRMLTRNGSCLTIFHKRFQNLLQHFLRLMQPVFGINR